jgi:integrase
MPRLKLTTRAVEKLPAPDPSGKQVLHWDTELKGFGVLCSGVRNTKTYVVQRDINGTTRRVTIGPCNVFSLDAARKEAQQKLADFYRGIDPKQGRRGAATLRETLDAYLELKKEKGTLRPASERNYRYSVERYLKDWLDGPLHSITSKMVDARHRAIKKEVEKRGRYQGGRTANYAMRVLGILWDFENDRLEKDRKPEDKPLPPNPAKLKKDERYKERPSERSVNEEDLPAFYAALDQLPNPIHRDYLKLMLFTGLRRTEAAALRWEDIDFDKRLIRLPHAITKAGRKLDLPMTDIVFDLLVARRAIGKDKFVFPSNGANGYFRESQYPLGLVARRTGIQMQAHDLRRNYLTVADDCEISWTTIKALVNHPLGKGVTEGYINKKVKTLREPAQKIADKLKELCHVPPITDEKIHKFR